MAILWHVKLRLTMAIEWHKSLISWPLWSIKRSFHGLYFSLEKYIFKRFFYLDYHNVY